MIILIKDKMCVKRQLVGEGFQIRDVSRRDVCLLFSTMERDGTSFAEVKEGKN